MKNSIEILYFYMSIFILYLYISFHHFASRTTYNIQTFRSHEDHDFPAHKVHGVDAAFAGGAGPAKVVMEQQACFTWNPKQPFPKDPDMSLERDFPYIPILGMGLRPSILL